MNFFKSVFSDDPDPPGSESEFDNAPHPQNPPHRDPSPADPGPSAAAADDTSDADAGGWNFGGLIKTLTTRSESIIETYRRDLQEFGTGLKKEIEVAHDSLETVGHAIDQLGSTVVKGTAQIISQGKDAILAVDLESDDNNSGKNWNKRGGEETSSLNSKGYSRFEAQVRAVQGDASTYCEEPEDLDEYGRWKLGFSLEGKGEEMEGLFRENDAMESIYKRVVPSSVDRESFWCRYYYKVYKLKKAEDVRARLVRRMSREEEDLSWDVEDDDDSDDEEEEKDENVGGGKSEDVIDKDVGGEKMGRRGGSELQDGNFDEKGVVGTTRLSVEEVHGSGEEGSKVEKRGSSLQSKELGSDSVGESKVESLEVVQEVGDGSNSSKEAMKEVDDTGKKNDSAAGSDEKVTMETKVGDGKATAVAASKHSAHEEEEEEEEDLGWDEIEDLSSVDEKKTTPRSGSPSKVDLRKRFSAAEEEEEEDLSWDVEDDDDEPAKA